ncbi:MAG: DinB family protein [Sphingobacteriales bacterium]|nr:MAG: DinB family protein [Sphingobacteriales bacterium]
MNTGKELVKTLGELADTVASFTQEKINTVPFEGSWTPGQVARHLIKSYGVAQTLKGHVTESNRQPDQNFEQIAAIFLNFESKLQSPEFIVPEDKKFNQQQLIDSIQHTKTEMQDITDNLDLTMLCQDFELPGGGVKFTRLEWMYMMLCHTKRHINQLHKIQKRMQAVAN